MSRTTTYETKRVAPGEMGCKNVTYVTFFCKIPACEGLLFVPKRRYIIIDSIEIFFIVQILVQRVDPDSFGGRQPPNQQALWYACFDAADSLKHERIYSIRRFVCYSTSRMSEPRA